MYSRKAKRHTEHHVITLTSVAGLANSQSSEIVALIKDLPYLIVFHIISTIRPNQVSPNACCEHRSILNVREGLLRGSGS